MSKCYSPCPQSHEHTYISSLLNHDSRTWDLNIIDTLFSENEAKIIKSTPISWQNVEDVRIWLYKNSGEFTVQSTYHFIRTQYCKYLPSSSHNPIDWKKVWQLNIPSKVSIFFWHLCSNALLVTENLNRRGVGVNPICGGFGSHAWL